MGITTVYSCVSPIFVGSLAQSKNSIVYLRSYATQISFLFYKREIREKLTVARFMANSFVMRSGTLARAFVQAYCQALASKYDYSGYGQLMKRVLRNSNISGSIPSDIGRLPKDVSYNYLEGSFPSWIKEPNLQLRQVELLLKLSNGVLRHLYRKTTSKSIFSRRGKGLLIYLHKALMDLLYLPSVLLQVDFIPTISNKPPSNENRTDYLTDWKFEDLSNQMSDNATIGSNTSCNNSSVSTSMVGDVEQSLDYGSTMPMLDSFIEEGR
ncbi:hypothetical protein FEM48_Zijuj03G0134500 [Ziziphus jujuba var. spinosa]|uniref:Uncharacterized protein n=1 Tax=Ziziphus jujuba var. spinosa TaxID=714518 RepID=A0A978VQK2_ZIZJJ|nr:hypothetical protein FEM48_Zijuj03G0134500 [Ziziphus jujuba var. spinosa]